MNVLLSYLIVAFVVISSLYADTTVAVESNVVVPNTDQEILSPRAEKIVNNASVVQIGQLEVIAFNKARSNMLQSRDTIAGYPIKGDLHILSKDVMAEIKNTVLKKNAYINIRRRCLNSSFIGIRFVEQDDVVEFALGLPCNQVLWAYKSAQEIKTWGGVLDHHLAKKIDKLFRRY